MNVTLSPKVPLLQYSTRSVMTCLTQHTINPCISDRESAFPFPGNDVLNTTHDQSLHFGPGVRLSLEKADSRGKRKNEPSQSSLLIKGQLFSVGQLDDDLHMTCTLVPLLLLLAFSYIAGTLKCHLLQTSSSKETLQLIRSNILFTYRNTNSHMEECSELH